MNQLSEIAGASSTFEFGGKTYTMSPLTIGDLAEFAQWAEDRAIAKAEKRIALMPDDKKAILQKAFDESDAGTTEARAMGTMDGIRMLSWLSLRRAHKDLTAEQVGDLVTMAELSKFRQRIDRLSGLEPDPNDQSPPGGGQSLGANSSGS